MKKQIQLFSQKPERSGISAKKFIIPAVVFILCLHALILANMLRISRFGAQISETMQANFTYLQVSKNYESGSETLFDKAQLYLNTGDPSYVDGYFYTAGEMQEQGQTLIQMLQGGQSNAAYEQIAATMRNFESRLQIECHAMRLSAEVFGLDLNNYPQLAEVTLTEAELRLSDEEKQRAAEELLADGSYRQISAETHERIGRAIQIFSAGTAETVAQQTSTLGKARTLQWIIALAIVILLNAMILLLFSRLLIPMERGVEKIQQGEELPTDKGVSEFRRLATSYNALLRHKKMTESYLRKQSQTDALTNLPNRLAFQDFISQLSWERSHFSATVFYLDINGLKEANDKHGHAYGDELLRKCASCILTTFGGEPGRKCFRFGGDEFAAFWTNVPEDQIAPALERFKQEQDAHGVSISVGYAYTEDLSQTSVDELFEEADKYMYEKKALYHREEAHAVQ